MTKKPASDEEIYTLIGGARGMEARSGAAIERARALPIWTGPVEPTLLSGGLSNINLSVDDAGRRYVIRVGEDEPVFGVSRAHELLAFRAAHAAGVAPEVVYAEPALMVIRFIDGASLLPADVREPARLAEVARLFRRLHCEAHKHLESTGFMFWPFQHQRSHIRLLQQRSDRLYERWRDMLPGLAAANEEMERALGRVNVVFGHNDLNPQNIMDDGERLWFVDWEFAGFVVDLFDLGVLAMNIEIGPEEADLLLEAYFDAPVSDELRYRFAAATVVAAIRETTWSFVSEVMDKPIDFDFRIYSTMNAERYERMYAEFRETYGASEP